MVIVVDLDIMYKLGLNIQTYSVLCYICSTTQPNSTVSFVKYEDMAKVFSVSIMTIQRCIDNLINAGLISKPVKRRSGIAINEKIINLLAKVDKLEKEFYNDRLIH